jgi:flagellar motor switch protein FliN/FliY
MERSRIEVQDWLLGELMPRLATAVEGLTAERPAVHAAGACAEPLASEGAFCWRQTFTTIPGEIWISGEENAWRDMGTWVLRAAGMDETAAEMRTEFVEMVRQTMAGVGQSITARLGSEVAPLAGVEGPIGTAEWTSIEAELSGTKVHLVIGIAPQLLDALIPPVQEPAAQEASANESTSATFDLLLDVELPVSISFGRAQVPLKDVLKLTVGSIVELNRTIGDPVEVIVNNCVIARGEVVVVDGNFGVRVQNVISKQERLRTLD